MSEFESQANVDVLAIVIHAFYADVFTKILQSLNSLSVPIKIYVTTTFEQEDKIRQILISIGYDFYLLSVVNHGRDVLPFFKIMPEVIRDGHTVLLKLHTKKTEHRKDGDIWMEDVLSKLAASDKVERYFHLLNSDEGIGMIAPAGHIISIPAYFGSNKERVLRISKRLGFSETDLMDTVFVAGTMFYAHIAALQPILKLAFTDKDFELENKQVDGTLAHAIERCFSISCLSANLKLISTDSVNVDASPGAQGNYAYAEATNHSKHASLVEKASFYLFKLKKLVIKFKNIMLGK
jgi:lipopolysaccharide biosynthesis protein